MGSAARSLLPLAVGFHHVVDAGSDREGVVPMALPHVSAENQPDAARFHGDPGFVYGRVVAHLAAAGNQDQRTARRLDDFAQAFDVRKFQVVVGFGKLRRRRPEFQTGSLSFTTLAPISHATRAA